MIRKHGILHTSDQVTIDLAYSFAKHHHDPYIVHPVAVAQIVQTVTQNSAVICAALLHDTIEDTPASFTDLFDHGFNMVIIDLVVQLTDISKPEDGNRATRKAIDRNHLANSSANGATIKLADMINNSQSIVKHDPKFAEVYMKEMSALLDVLRHGNKELYMKASDIVLAYYSS